MNLPVVIKKGEARVDSRLLAPLMGNKHKNVIDLIERYRDRFEQFGIVPFQTEKFPRRGRPERFGLLNEDQCYLLLTFARNNGRVVEMKVQLVKAFSEARKAAELHQEYLPEYHALHDQMARLAQDSTHARHVHMNMNKLINAAAGVQSGQRSAAPVPQKAMLIAAQHLANKAVQGATDHRDGYAKAKEALAPFLPHKLLGG